MRVVVHHTEYFEWEPVPPDVTITEADVAAGKVRPAARQMPGTDRLAPVNWTMRVAKTAPNGTHTEAHVPDEMIFHTLFHRDVRPLRLSRRQGLALHLAKYVYPERLPTSSITDVEVHDDGPAVAAVKALLDTHVAAGNIDASEHAEHMAKFTESHAPHKSHADAHTEHLRTHFRVKPKAVAS